MLSLGEPGFSAIHRPVFFVVFIAQGSKSEAASVCQFGMKPAARIKKVTT